MEQLQFIKQQLEIRQFPELKTKQSGMVRAPEIILASLVLTFVFNLVGVYTFTYLLIGFALPAVCRYKDIKIFHYWECFAMLLFLRTITDAFQTFDGLFLVLLWHPTFKFGQKIIDWIKSFKEKGHIDKGITEIKKML